MHEPDSTTVRCRWATGGGSYTRLGLLVIKRKDDCTRYAFTSLAVLFFEFDGDYSSDALSFARVAQF